MGVVVKKKKQTEAKITKMVISPEKAAMMLKRNTKNRPLKLRKVEQYAQKMRDGKWKLTNDAISYSGLRLINGQHRLSAVVESGTTQEFFVAEGMDDNVFDVMDTGMGRSAGDVLAIKGFKSYTALAAVTSFVVKHKMSINHQGGRGARKVQNDDVLAFANKHSKALGDSVRVAYHYDKTLLGRSIVGGLHYLFAEKHARKATEFFTKFRTGPDQKADNPIYQLFQALYQNAMANKKYSSNMKIMITVKAWNAFIDGVDVKRYAIGPKEKMPEIR